MKRNARIMLLAPALGLLAAGCGGGGSKTVTQTVISPGTTTEPATIPATTPATTPTVSTLPAETSGGGSRTGKVGDTIVLLGSEFAHVPAGKTRGPKDKIAATVTGVVDPISGYDIAKTDRLVGIRMKVRNVGTVKYTDFQPSGDLSLVGGGTGKGTSLITVGGKKVCEDPALKLQPGASGEVCMAFQVPKAAKLQAFQYTSDIGDGQSGLWKLR